LLKLTYLHICEWLYIIKQISNLFLLLPFHSLFLFVFLDVNPRSLGQVELLVSRLLHQVEQGVFQHELNQVARVLRKSLFLDFLAAHILDFLDHLLIWFVVLSPSDQGSVRVLYWKNLLASWWLLVVNIHFIDIVWGGSGTSVKNLVDFVRVKDFMNSLNENVFEH